MAERIRRSEQERVRIRHTVDVMRPMLDGIEKALALPGPIGTDAAQAIVTAALAVAMGIAKSDAFDLAETSGTRTGP